jgi:hypothetical protein
MAFVRAKRVGNHTYYSLVENYRWGGKVCQETIAYMGKHATIEEAYQHWKKIANAQGSGTRDLERLRAREHMEGLYEYRPEGCRQRDKRATKGRADQRQERPQPQRAAMTRAQAAEILDLPMTATGEQIKARYRELVKQTHPDAAGSGKEHLFRMVQKAYDVLCGAIGTTY